MFVPKVESMNSSPSPKDLIPPQGLPLHSPRAREKSKRPQLSCNACRARKVKCDRVQPCTACSLHQIAELCHYDLTETERQPILQAEALKDKDKEIARLRREIQLLSNCGQSVKPDVKDLGHDARTGRQNVGTSKMPKSIGKLQQKRRRKDHPADNGQSVPGATGNILEEFDHLTVDTKAAAAASCVVQIPDLSSFQTATSHPFPTLWSAQEGTSCLIGLLPNRGEIFSYLDSFERRVQGLFFPYVPKECFKQEAERFLDNLEHNALVYPDVLALLFAALALGLQTGVYDRCGERWIAAAIEIERKKGDVFIAAAMQALRMASFLNRPTIPAIETLVMIGPYLTNTGKFLDAWALFGITIRLAQRLGLHLDANYLKLPAPPDEIEARKHLWWWMLNMDEQYSVTLGRSLGISSIGNCPAPIPANQDPVVHALMNFNCRFIGVARRVLSSGPLTNAQIDDFTDQIQTLGKSLPVSVRFDQGWLYGKKATSNWPSDAQAALLSGKLHTLLIFLNRQRLESTSFDTSDSAIDLFTEPNGYSASLNLRGCDLVLQSSRIVLQTFEFLSTRSRAAMVCWTIGQQAFNAAVLLLISMYERRDNRDNTIVQKTYGIFIEMQRLGIHCLAGAAAKKLENLRNALQSGDATGETVMGRAGMILLEAAGLHESPSRAISPAQTPMTEHAIQYDGKDAQEETASPKSAKDPSIPQSSKKRIQRKNVVSTATKAKASAKKSTLQKRRYSVPTQRNSGLWMKEAWQLGFINNGADPKNPSPSLAELSPTNIHITLPNEPVTFDDYTAQQTPISMPSLNYQDSSIEHTEFEPQSAFGAFHRSPSFPRLSAGLETPEPFANTGGQMPNIDLPQMHIEPQLQHATQQHHSHFHPTSQPHYNCAQSLYGQPLTHAHFPEANDHRSIEPKYYWQMQYMGTGDFR